MDIRDVDETVNSGSELGEFSETAYIGTQDTPMPIFYVRMVPITDLLVEPLWPGEWSEVQQKKTYLESALLGYPAYLGAQIYCGKSQKLHGLTSCMTLIKLTLYNTHHLSICYCHGYWYIATCMYAYLSILV